MTEDLRGTPPSKAEYVVQRLREEILTGRMAPGDPLHQGELATRYGVSATPVREALRRLEAEGLITYAPHHGATVTSLEGTELEDFYRLRSVMEGFATRLATERAEASLLEQLRSLHAELSAGRGSDQPRLLAQLNRRFHFRIYEVGSRLVAGQIRSLWSFIPPEVTLWTHPQAAELFVHQHAGIIDAIASSDAAAAEVLMAEHVLAAAQQRSLDREEH